MRYWWVNQNQTYTAEVSGGYLWSPKRNKNGARNQFYENMREVQPGDRVFSFRDTKIGALGTVLSHCYDAPKPAEFGTAGANWDQAGWRVDVRFAELAHPVRPKDHVERIRPLLPAKYSPLQESGDGLQSVYLAALPEALGLLLSELLQDAGNDINLTSGPVDGVVPGKNRAVEQIENAAESEIEAAPLLSETVKEQLVKARRGQGRFRENVQRIEKGCRVSGVSASEFLIASHIKPWRVASNEERLDGENGLLLTPNVDLLFDHGFISFDDDGTLLVSPVADTVCLQRLGLPGGKINVGPFTPNQRKYLSYHRRNLFLEAGRDG